jgi:hypothetical protein
MDTSHIKDCLSLFRQLDGRPFAYLKGLTEDNFSVDSVENENDTLNIGGYAVMQSTEQVPTVAGSRETPVFIVFATVVTSGGYWEPDDADLSEIARASSFSNAVRDIVLQEVFQYVGNIQEADGLYAALSEE